MQIHEGELLRKHILGKGWKMGTTANNLEMTRQNLSHHLRKDVLDSDFKRLVTDKLKISFPIGKQDNADNSAKEPNTGRDATLQAILTLAENNSVLIQNESRLISLLEKSDAKVIENGFEQILSGVNATVGALREFLIDTVAEITNKNADDVAQAFDKKLSETVKGIGK